MFVHCVDCTHFPPQDLPGGGVKDETSVEVEDFSQDLTVKLNIFHKTFDEEEVSTSVHSEASGVLVERLFFVFVWLYPTVRVALVWLSGIRRTARLLICAKTLFDGDDETSLLVACFRPTALFWPFSARGVSFFVIAASRCHRCRRVSPSRAMPRPAPLLLQRRRRKMEVPPQAPTETRAKQVGVCYGCERKNMKHVYFCGCI